MYIRVRSRFFGQVGHETMYASSGNKYFSLNPAIVRPTKIKNRANKNWAQFYRVKYLKNQNFQKHFLLKAGLLVQYSSKKENRKIQSIFNTEKWL